MIGLAAGVLCSAHGALQIPSDSIVLASAKKYGRIMCNWFLKKTPKMSTDYPSSCAFYGVCIFSEAMHDTSLLNAVSQKYATFIAAGPAPSLGTVDKNVHGIVPFELYRQTKDARFLPVGVRIADDEFSAANLRPDSLSAYSRFWVDDMYMIGSLQTQAYKSTNKTIYLNNAARTLWRYEDSLQQPNGLFYHSYFNNALFYWGRGNGWAAASTAELLSVLPADHPQRPAIMTSYKSQMDALYKNQDPTGMWHQLVDNKTTFIESSCTAMFIFGLATGLDHGWIAGDTFKVAVKKGWTALAGYFDTVNGLKNVCIGLNALADSANYTKHAMATGDTHGTASFIWAATAMVRLLDKPDVSVARVAQRTLPKFGPRSDKGLYTLQGRLIDRSSWDAAREKMQSGVYIYKGKRTISVP
jgi:rhamnogalacturonyl hydrolase YesR